MLKKIKINIVIKFIVNYMFESNHWMSLFCKIFNQNISTSLSYIWMVLHIVEI